MDDLPRPLDGAECLFTREQVEQALDTLADRLNRAFAGRRPVVLGIMNGALVPLGYLLPRLGFELELDYIHLTRYRQKLEGAETRWLQKARLPLFGREVLLVDDIFDQGITLREAVHYCRQAGAEQVTTAVLVRKRLVGMLPVGEVDYWALDVPDRYVFGYGMDYRGWWRNAPGIFVFEQELP